MEIYMQGRIYVFQSLHCLRGRVWRCLNKGLRKKKSNSLFLLVAGQATHIIYCSQSAHTVVSRVCQIR
jgi:hypothetical protein